MQFSIHKWHNGDKILGNANNTKNNHLKESLKF